MTIGIDTDVFVSWTMAGAARHDVARAFMQRQVAQGRGLAFTLQVIFEFVHIVTDPRRFERPMTMHQALDVARNIWDAPEVVRVPPAPATLHRTLELLRTLGLGRKRILDTALAATLERAGITRLATFNGKDFKAFAFLEVVDPAHRRKEGETREQT